MRRFSGPGFPFQYYSPYRRNNFYNTYRPYQPVQEASNTCLSTGKNSDDNINNTNSIVKENSHNETRNTKKAKSDEAVWLDLFGIKLYFDDVLILSLLFFLYKEEVKDEGLFLSLVLLLIS